MYSRKLPRFAYYIRLDGRRSGRGGRIIRQKRGRQIGIRKRDRSGRDYGSVGIRIIIHTRIRNEAYGLQRLKRDLRDHGRGGAACRDIRRRRTPYVKRMIVHRIRGRIELGDGLQSRRRTHQVRIGQIDHIVDKGELVGVVGQAREQYVRI